MPAEATISPVDISTVIDTGNANVRVIKNTSQASGQKAIAQPNSEVGLKQASEKVPYEAFTEKASSIRKAELVKLGQESVNLSPKDILAIDKKVYRAARKFVRDNYTFGNNLSGEQAAANTQIESLTDKYVHSALISMTVEHEDALERKKAQTNSAGEASNSVKNTAEQTAVINDQLNDLATRGHIGTENAPDQVSSKNIAADAEEPTGLADSSDNNWAEKVADLPADNDSTPDEATVQPPAVELDLDKTEFAALRDQLDSEADPVKKQEIKAKMQEVWNKISIQSEFAQQRDLYEKEQDPIKREELKKKLESILDERRAQRGESSPVQDSPSTIIIREEDAVEPPTVVTPHDQITTPDKWLTQALGIKPLVEDSGSTTRQEAAPYDPAKALEDINKIAADLAAQKTRQAEVEELAKKSAAWGKMSEDYYDAQKAANELKKSAMSKNSLLRRLWPFRSGSIDSSTSPSHKSTKASENEYTKNLSQAASDLQKFRTGLGQNNASIISSEPDKKVQPVTDKPLDDDTKKPIDFPVIGSEQQQKAA